MEDGDKVVKEPNNTSRVGDEKYPKFADPYVLDELDKAIIKHVIDFPWEKKHAIAAKFKLSSKQLYLRLKKPAMKKAFDDLFQKTLEIIEKNNNLAFRRLARLINDPDPWVALKAIELQLRPFLNQSKLEIKQVQEVIYRARFGDDGAIVTDKEEIADTTPKNTLELIAGGKA
jgi:hypothetical protein